MKTECAIAILGAGLLCTAAADGAPTSYAELVTLDSASLARVDIARMNLLCTEGLPGIQTTGIPGSLRILDDWARLVGRFEKHSRSLYDRNPGRYDYSLAKFKAVNLALTLKQDLGCRYNPELLRSGAMKDIRSTRFFRDPDDLFLQGFVKRKSGSCASLPVLMVAVGRRCGYPLKLVTCKGHLFCRWDDGRERFNIETACAGMDSPPDAHYRQWPYPSTEAEIRAEGYLKSLSPAEELGVFLQLRAMCLEEHRRFPEAAEAYRLALRAFPNSRLIRQHLNHLEGRL